MGVGGSMAVKEVASLILLDDNVANVVEAIREGNSIRWPRLETNKRV